MAHGDVIPEWGGYLEYEDYWGRIVTWVAYTNYPRPYWNEWEVFFEQGQRVSGPFEAWWYGEWVVTTRSPDLIVVANASPRS